MLLGAGLLIGVFQLEVVFLQLALHLGSVLPDLPHEQHEQIEGLAQLALDFVPAQRQPSPCIGLLPTGDQLEQLLLLDL